MEQMIMRTRDVLRHANITRSTLYRWLEAGRFPKPVQLGPRAVGWRRSDVIEWIASLPHANTGDGDGSGR